MCISNWLQGKTFIRWGWNWDNQTLKIKMKQLKRFVQNCRYSLPWESEYHFSAFAVIWSNGVKWPKSRLPRLTIELWSLSWDQYTSTSDHFQRNRRISSRTNTFRPENCLLKNSIWNFSVESEQEEEIGLSLPNNPVRRLEAISVILSSRSFRSCSFLIPTYKLVKGLFYKIVYSPFGESFSTWKNIFIARHNLLNQPPSNRYTSGWMTSLSRIGSA